MLSLAPTKALLRLTTLKFFLQALGVLIHLMLELDKSISIYFGLNTFMIQNYNPCSDCELNDFELGCIASLFASRVGLPPLHPDNCQTAHLNILRFSSQMTNAIRDFEYDYECSLSTGELF